MRSIFLIPSALAAAAFVDPCSGMFLQSPPSLLGEDFPFGDDGSPFGDSFPFGDDGSPFGVGDSFPFGDDSPFNDPSFPFGGGMPDLADLQLNLPNVTLGNGANMSNPVVSAAKMLGSIEGEDGDTLLDDLDDVADDMNDDDDDDDVPTITIGSNTGTLDLGNDDNGSLLVNGKNINATGSVSISSSANGTFVISSEAGRACIKACGSMYNDDNFFKGTNKSYTPCSAQCYQEFGVKQ